MIRGAHSLQFTAHRFVLFLLSAFCLWAANCYSQETVSSAELIQNAELYDGQEVVYEGEVVGELMRRKDGAWVNISDGKSSIGVWMPTELADVIEYKGSYKTQGDILQVAGQFNRACPMHGGDLDIHAISAQKIKSGWQKQESIIPAKHNLLIILTVVLCLVLILKILIFR